MFIWTTRTILVFGKKRSVYGKTLPQKNKIGKFHFLRLSGKWINSSGVSFPKLSYVRLLPQGLLFLKNSHFWKFGTCPVWKSVHFLIFGDFSKNGSPGQTTVLTRFVSKFCVEPRSQSPNMSHLESKCVWKTPNRASKGIELRHFIWKLSRDDCGMVRNIFKSHFGLGNKLKSQFWTPKLKISFVWNLEFSVFVQNWFFQSQISRYIL